jgi:hypothetical protein
MIVELSHFPLLVAKEKLPCGPILPSFDRGASGQHRIKTTTRSQANPAHTRSMPYQYLIVLYHLSAGSPEHAGMPVVSISIHNFRLNLKVFYYQMLAISRAV